MEIETDSSPLRGGATGGERFIVDSTDTRPIAMFNTEDAANMFRDDLAADPESNTEYDVSPCLVDISHRDNFEVPK